MNTNTQAEESKAVVPPKSYARELGDGVIIAIVVDTTTGWLWYIGSHVPLAAWAAQATQWLAYIAN